MIIKYIHSYIMTFMIIKYIHLYTVIMKYIFIYFIIIKYVHSYIMTILMSPEPQRPPLYFCQGQSQAKGPSHFHYRNKTNLYITMVMIVIMIRRMMGNRHIIEIFYPRPPPHLSMFDDAAGYDKINVHISRIRHVMILWHRESRMIRSALL